MQLAVGFSFSACFWVQKNFFPQEMDQISKILKKKQRKKPWISIIGLSRSPSVQDALLLFIYYLFIYYLFSPILQCSHWPK
jgi:hypothetical protein